MYASPAAVFETAVRTAVAIDRDAWAGATRSEELVGLLAARERLDALIIPQRQDREGAGRRRHQRRARRERGPEHEDVILDAARSLPPSGFRQVMQHRRNCCDAVTDQRDAQARVEGSYFDIAPTFEGVGHLDDRLDAVSTSALIRVLDRMDRLDAFDGVTPPRTLAQRRAAALMRLVCGWCAARSRRSSTSM